MGDDYDGPERRRSPRSNRGEALVAWRLGGLEHSQEEHDRRMDKLVTREELKENYATRAEIARDFLPRNENTARREWNLRILTVALAMANVAQGFAVLILSSQH